MFYAKAVNCCNDVLDLLNSGPDGGFCAAAGDCRGFNGTCGELPAQFAKIAVLPHYPNGLVDYTCTAFPNDDNRVDSFIVALISLAIGASAFSPARAACCARALCPPSGPLTRRCAGRSRANAPARAAIPVTIFISTCFSIANDNEAPESWLDWSGWRKFVFGLNGARH
jgi:hypothetical protein